MTEVLYIAWCLFNIKDDNMYSNVTGIPFLVSCTWPLLRGTPREARGLLCNIPLAFDTVCKTWL